MGLIAKNTGGGNFEPISEGLHQAVCYSLYDLGTKYNERFEKSVHRILICWEIPGERIDIEKDGETKNLPRATSKEFTLSLHEKSLLRKTLESWRGKAFSEKELEGFDLTKLLGANCMIQIIHTKKENKTYANVQTIVQLPKEMVKKSPENPTRYFAFEEHGDVIPEGTPDWIKDKIKASDEWDHIAGGYDGNPSQDPPGHVYDEIPF